MYNYHVLYNHKVAIIVSQVLGTIKAMEKGKFFHKSQIEDLKNQYGNWVVQNPRNYHFS